MTWVAWQIFTRSLEILKIGTLMGNVKKCMSLKFRENLWVMTMKNDAKFDKELSCHFKFEMRNLINFWSEHSKVSKMCTLMGSSWTKYIMFELKKYKGVMFHGTEEWCKILRKTYLRFGKWYQEFGKFLPELSKVSKLRLIWDLFIQSRKCMSLKFTWELCIMTMKNNAKFD